MTRQARHALVARSLRPAWLAAGAHRGQGCSGAPVLRQPRQGDCGHHPATHLSGGAAERETVAAAGATWSQASIDLLAFSRVWVSEVRPRVRIATVALVCTLSTVGRVPCDVVCGVCAHSVIKMLWAGPSSGVPGYALSVPRFLPLCAVRARNRPTRASPRKHSLPRR